jgi:hypothetical protein
LQNWLLKDLLSVSHHRGRFLLFQDDEDETGDAGDVEGATPADRFRHGQRLPEDYDIATR